MTASTPLTRRDSGRIFSKSASISTGVRNPISDPERTPFTMRTTFAQQRELQPILRLSQTTQYSRDRCPASGAEGERIDGRGENRLAVGLTSL